MIKCIFRCHLVFKDVMMLSTPQAAWLAVTIIYFPPFCFYPPHLTAQGWLQVFLSRFLAPFKSGFPLKYFQKDGGTMYPKASRSNQKLCVSLDGCNWKRMGRAWLTSQSHGGGAGVWRTGMSSSLRELCLSLTTAVCHTAERRGHTFSSHESFHPGHHGTTLPHILHTSKGKHVILLSSHSAKKAPLPPRDLYSSSADRSAEPSPSVIYLSVFLSLCPTICLQSLLYTSVHSLGIPVAFVSNQ